MWFNLDRISNHDPTQDEFNRMFQMFKLKVPSSLLNAEEETKGGRHSGGSKNYMGNLLIERNMLKAVALERILKEGPPKYDDEMLESMIMKNVEKKLKLGQGGSLNLPQLKTDITGKITGLELIRDNPKTKPSDADKLKPKLDYLYRLQDQIDQSIIE